MDERTTVKERIQSQCQIGSVDWLIDKKNNNDNHIHKNFETNILGRISFSKNIFNRILKPLLDEIKVTVNN